MPGWGTDIGSSLDLTKQQCAEKCNGENSCMSFEHSDTDMKCNLNKIAEPSQGPFRDYVFCTKIGRLINLVNVSLDLLAPLQVIQKIPPMYPITYYIYG